MNSSIPEEPPNRITIDGDGAEALRHSCTIKRVVDAALSRHDKIGAQVQIVLVDDDTIARLNERHLGHVGATDVLTFDLRDDSAQPGIEGEIVISVETAGREAVERGHALEAELALYAVHGVLHLLGYDDQDAAQAEVMHRLEDEILLEAGIGRIFAVASVSKRAS